MLFICTTKAKEKLLQKNTEIWLLNHKCKYIYSLLMFVVKNRSLFKLNYDIHGFSTRYDNDFHLPANKPKIISERLFLLRN
jgi:hypothetical protein